MARIFLDEATVQFRVLSGRDKSLRRVLASSVVGGVLGRGPKGSTEITALDSVRLTIGPGERVGLMGSNGSGKTTMLRVFSRVYRPTSGSALVDGSVTALSDIALGMNPEVSGIKNIFLLGALLGMSDREIKTGLDEIIDFSGLGDFINLPMRTYSTGMQMRLSFAVSTVSAPDVLLMDEWLSVGDETFKVRAEERLQSLIEETKILVLASHSRSLLESVCTRGIILEHGRVVRDGPIHDLTEEYFSPTES